LFFVFVLQVVPEKSKESLGSAWQFVGLLPLFDPPRHDSAETIRRALNLGVNVKMITGNANNCFVFLKNAIFFCSFLSYAHLYYCFHVQVINLP
jgi:hypothetical protein